MVKQLYSAVLCVFILSVPFVHAFTFFGIDWTDVWHKIKFWDKDEKVISNLSSIKQIEKTNKSSKNIINKKKNPVYIMIAGTNYTTDSIKNIINNNEELKSYVKGFGYDCLYINTDKSASFTMNFDTQKGKVNSVKKGDFCDNEIYLEESLITDIQTNGFKASNIKSYLEKVDLPTSMYFKAIKIFTIG